MGLYTKNKKKNSEKTLESLLQGDLFRTKRQTTGGRILNSARIENILYDSSRSSESFFMEAGSLIGEAIAIESYLDVSIRQLDKSVSLVKTVKEKFGLEKLDPLYFVLESGTETEAADVKVKKEKAGQFWKNVLNAIMEFFQRMILAIANFVKGIQVWLAGPLAKGESDFYVRYKGEIEKAYAALKDSKDVTVVGTPILIGLKTFFETTIRTNGIVIDSYKEQIKIFSDVVKEKNEDERKKLIEKIRDDYTAVISVRADSLRESANPRSDKGGPALLSGGSVARVDMYGESAKSESHTVGELFKSFQEIDFVLSSSFIGTLKSYINTSKQKLTLDKLVFSEIQRLKMDKSDEAFMGEAVKCLQLIRKSSGYQTSRFYATWSIAMKQRSLAVTCCKALLRAAKKSTTASVAEAE